MAPERGNKFTIMLSDDEQQQVEALAEADGSSVSEYVRRLIRHAASKADWVTVSVAGSRLVVSGVPAGRAKPLLAALEHAFTPRKGVSTHFAAIVEQVRRILPDVLVRDRTGVEKIRFDDVEIVV